MTWLFNSIAGLKLENFLTLNADTENIELGKQILTSLSGG